MRQVLRPHPDSRSDAVASLEVEAVRMRGGALELHYVLTGVLQDLSLPPVAASMRADDLWRHTCFEAFVRAPHAEAYFEFNFAPSTAWAAYRFDRYRTGMTSPPAIAPPRIEARAAGATYELKVRLDLAGLPDLPAGAAWGLGISAVIEAADGAKSYWALAHPAAKPDFHHADGFASQLPAPEPA